MSYDGRNFRSSYYDRALGCYSVEEKKSLNKLLQDKVRHFSKLKQFALSYTVPTAQRVLLWGITLGVFPLHNNSTEYILEQRAHVYDDLLRAVRVMQYADASTPKHKAMHSMWLLEQNRLLHAKSPDDDDDKNFVELVKVLLQIFDNDVEIYWISKAFFLCLKEIQQEKTKLKEQTMALLQREDIELYNHLDKLSVFNNCEFMDRWYDTCFAGVINESCLVKVWDKICGGSRKIVIFVCLELVKTLKESILQCCTLTEFKNAVEKNNEQGQGSAIVNKAIKSWQSNKKLCEITVH